MRRRGVLAGLGGLLACPMCARELRASEGWSHDHQDEWGGVCKTGVQQSPIDITTSVLHSRDPLQFHLPDEIGGTIKNNGHTIEVEVHGAAPFLPGHMPDDSKTASYAMKQFHFHAPSEHSLAGVRAQLEVHFVHVSEATKDLAVVGVLLNGGGEDADNALMAISRAAPKQHGGEATLPSVRLETLLPPATKGGRQYYQYAGSLTTPPCTESVSWFVLREPVTVPKSAALILAALCNVNARQLQPLNRRFIIAM